MLLNRPLRVALVLLLCGTAHAAFVNPGTPKNIPGDFDCAVRKAAYKHGQMLMPARKGFSSLFDALQLSNGCGVPAPAAEDAGAWAPPRVAPSVAGGPTQGAFLQPRGPPFRPRIHLHSSCLPLLCTNGTTRVLLSS